MATCETSNTLLTVQDAAKHFSVSRATILKWAASGELRGIRIGNVLRFTPAAIEEFIHANEAQRSS